MASSDPEIKDTFTLPAWMKSKPAKEYEPFAGSPPAPEDSFFYIRYPKTDVLFGKQNLDRDAPRVYSEQSKELRSSTSYVVKEKDWSKHTKPCQDVMHGIAPINTAMNPASSKPKPAGVDDGFKGEGAACGTSIVKVAHQMMSSKGSSRGFTVASPDDDAVAPELHQYNLMSRRGSKSLPATPAHSPSGSPASRRRFNGNRYFTSPYEPVEDGSGGSRSWLTAALLGFKKDLASSTSTLAEEDTHDHMAQLTLAESVENLGPSPKRQEVKSIAVEPSSQFAKPLKPASAAYRPKPSELREMNFWSPTSM